MEKPFISLGAGFAFVGVALGAFGTHALRGRVPVADLQIWATGVQYHTVHALALILVGIVAQTKPSRMLERTGWLLAAGILIFSGSLYLLVLTNQRWLGAVTPLGGLCLLAGWGTFAFATKPST